MADDRYVVTTFNYTAPMDVEPEYYLYEPEPGTVKHEPVQDPHEMRVHDVRGQESDYTLDGDGFAIVDIDAEVSAFSDRDLVRKAYYPTVAERVKQATGASHVHVLDHNFRSPTVTERNTTDANPVMWVHNDYTELSAPQRVRDLLPEDEAERRLKSRYMFLNLWRPVTRPVEESPLGVCSAKSIQQSDFVTLALRYRNRNGQVYFARHNPNHQWFYQSAQKTDEALLLKCFDSAPAGGSHYTMHSAFEDPTSQPDAQPRESIEARTIAFFD